MSPYSLAQALNSIHAERDNFQLKNKSMLNAWPTECVDVRSRNDKWKIGNLLEMHQMPYPHPWPLQM